MKIITSVVNTDFIKLQYLSLKKFINQDFEYIIFNDAKNFNDLTNNNNLNMKKDVLNLCNELNINCINHDNDFHINIPSSSFRHATVLNNMLLFQLNNPDKYLYIDSDMILIDYLDINKYNNYSCAIVLQHRVDNNNKDINYIWPGLCYFDMDKIYNKSLLNWSLANYTDTGGMMYRWLINQNNYKPFPSCIDIRNTNNIEKYHTDTIYYIKHLWSSTWDISELPDKLKHKKDLVNLLISDNRNKNNKITCELYDDVFLHYRGGTGWSENVDDNIILELHKILNL